MKHEKSLEFNTTELSHSEAVKTAEDTLEQHSSFKVHTQENSETHTMVKSSGNSVSVMKMGTTLRVHLKGNEDVMDKVEQNLKQGPKSSGATEKQEGEMYETKARKQGPKTKVNDQSPQGQTEMIVHEDGTLEIMQQGNRIEMLTEVGLFATDSPDGLTVENAYFTDDFGDKYDSNDVETLINSIRMMLLEEVR